MECIYVEIWMYLSSMGFIKHLVQIPHDILRNYLKSKIIYNLDVSRKGEIIS